jgi:hypothetical protein
MPSHGKTVAAKLKSLLKRGATRRSGAAAANEPPPMKMENFLAAPPVMKMENFLSKRPIAKPPLHPGTTAKLEAAQKAVLNAVAEERARREAAAKNLNARLEKLSAINPDAATDLMSEVFALRLGAGTTRKASRSKSKSKSGSGSKKGGKKSA